MDNFLEIASHDAFRFRGGLNKSAADIYLILLKEPMTANQLVDKSGRGRATVFRVLRNMRTLANKHTGEIYPMVRVEDGIWHACPNVDLDKVALIIGTAGIGKRKRELYRREQRDHRSMVRPAGTRDRHE